MGLSNTKIEKISALIERRINKRIDEIMRENAEAVDGIRDSIREASQQELGVSEEYAEMAVLEDKKEKLQKQTMNLESKIDVLKRKVYSIIFPKRDPDEWGYYGNKNDVQRRFSDRQTLIENARFDEHEELREVSRLRGELERIEESLWIATSEKHIREIMDGLNTILGDTPTQLEQIAQDSTPPSNPSS